jgi:hypothetical protein
MALGLSIALSVALGPNVGASGHTYTDAPRHDVYAATARCWQVPSGRIPGVPVTAIMRDDEDAIDAALMRFDDLGMACLGAIDVSVVHIP